MTVMQCVTRQIVNLVPIETTTFFDIDGGNSGDFEDLADAIFGVWDSIKAYLDAQWSVQDMLVRIPDGTGTPYATYTPASAIVGAITGSDAPRGISLVSFFRHSGPKPNRGWNFITGWNVGQITAVGDPDTSSRAAVSLYAANLFEITAINGKDAAWSIARLAGSPQTVAASNPVTSASTSTNFHFLRSRVS